MSTVSISLALAIRVVLVLLFLPFSALDKVLDFRSAVAQAQEAVPNKAAATALILVGLLSKCLCRRELFPGLRIGPARSCLLATVR
jgi:putative oxidoreductase